MNPRRRNRYTYFASKAGKEGYVQIADIFTETANQEKEHAKRFFSFLEGGMLEITAGFPAGVVGTTLENLLAAAAGEHEEHTDLYPAFARVARAEGFEDIAGLFEKISVAEKQHEKRYRDLAANVQAGKVFKKDKKVTWRCRNCGYLHEGEESPEICPACAIPRPILSFWEKITRLYLGISRSPKKANAQNAVNTDNLTI